MTAVQYEDEIVILDAGLWIEKVMLYDGEEENAVNLPVEKLYDFEIIPDDRDFYKKHGKKVKAILVTHAHLDHSGAIPHIAPKYSCPVIATPFTIEVIKKVYRDVNKRPSRLVTLNPGSTYKVSKNIVVEFVYATHSTPQTVMIAVHTPDGIIVYANDWKFDEYPVLGRRTDYKRLRELGEEGVLALISDSTRINQESRTHSESIVYAMLKDVLFWVENKDKLIIVTTFASHIARINTLVNLAREMKRKPIILGRSMSNYISAAENVGLVRISKKASIFGRRKSVAQILKKIDKNRGEYLIICTGNQGEPNSVLSRIANGEYPMHLVKGDQVIFCSTVIPSPINQAQRAEIERKLRNQGVRIFKDVHTSGHASREDHRDLINILKPKHYIPTHGGMDKLASATELAVEMGYVYGKTTHIIQDGQELEIE